MNMPVNQIERQLRPARGVADKFISVFYSYSMLFSAVASGATSNQNLQIQADSNFMITELSYFAFDTTTNAAPATFTSTIQLTDTGSGMTLFDRAIPITSVFGTAQLPFVMPISRVISANAVLTGTLNAGVLANATTIYLVFHGFKIYKG